MHFKNLPKTFTIHTHLIKFIIKFKMTKKNFKKLNEPFLWMWSIYLNITESIRGENLFLTKSVWYSFGGWSWLVRPYSNLKILRSNVLSALISTHKDSRLNTFRLESKGDFYNIHKRKNQVVSLGLHHSYHTYLYIVLQKIAR